jgi:hypothetical protein
LPDSTLKTATRVIFGPSRRSPTTRAREHDRLDDSAGWFVQMLISDRFGFGQLPGLSFPDPPLRPGRPCFHGRLECHPVKPVAEFLTRHDRSCPPREDKKSGLKSIFGVVVIREETAADAPDERPESLDNRLEGRGLTPFHEPIEQLPVREHSDGTRIEEGAKLSNRRMRAALLHHAAPSILPGLYSFYYRVEPRLIHYSRDPSPKNSSRRLCWDSRCLADVTRLQAEQPQYLVAKTLDMTLRGRDDLVAGEGESVGPPSQGPPKQVLSSSARRSHRPKRFSPIDPGLFQSPCCAGNDLCPSAGALCCASHFEIGIAHPWS